MSSYFKTYEIPEGVLNQNELKVVELLKQAGMLISEIFNTQISFGFYPENSSAAEIAQAALSNPLIKNPYSMVKRDSTGSLTATLYHEVFKDQLAAISDLLTKASTLADNESFKRYLIIASKALVSGDYAPLRTAWVEIDSSSKLHLVIGPWGSYADKVLGVKHSYNFCLTYASGIRSYHPEEYIDVVRHMTPPFGSAVRQDIPAEKIQVRIDEVIAVAGRSAHLPPRAVAYLPDDPKEIKESGLKIVVYVTTIEEGAVEAALPLFRELMVPEIASKFDDETLLNANVRLAMVHEIVEAMFQYPQSVERLKGMHNPLMQLHANILGIKACAHQVVKGALNENLLEAMIHILLIRVFSDLKLKKTSSHAENFLMGYRLFLNYSMEKGAVSVENGYLVPKPHLLFQCVEDVASQVIKLFTIGTEAQVGDYFNQYGSDKIYSVFSEKLLKYDLK